MSIKIPRQAQYIISMLNSKGFEAYVVGGCVRDSLLGKIPNDWDICTAARPEQTMECFEGEQIVKTGLKHGTISILLDGETFEVTTYRKDGIYSDNRHPDTVEFVGDIKEDLCRRDFTINALAYNTSQGIKDYFGGGDDIKRRIIRCVGNATDRFNQDGLRVMRAIRFATDLDFELDDETVEGIWDCGKNLENVSQERKRDELKKILCAIRKLKKDTPHYNTTRTMIEYIIKLIIPEFRELAQITHNNPHHYTDVFTHTMDMLFIAQTDDIELLLAVLLHDIGKMKAKEFDERRLINNFYKHAVYSVQIAKNIMQRFKLDNKTIEAVLNLIEMHEFVIEVNRKCAKKLLNRLGFELCAKLLRLQLLDKKVHSWSGQRGCEKWALEAAGILQVWSDIIENNEAYRISDLAVNGHDLMKMGIGQGKAIGEALNKLLDLVVEQKVENTKESLLKCLKLFQC